MCKKKYHILFSIVIQNTERPVNTKYGELIRFVTTDKRLNVYVIISNVLQAITNVNVLNTGKADMELQCWKT